jgi:hypothetical protein
MIMNEKIICDTYIIYDLREKSEKSFIEHFTSRNKSIRDYHGKGKIWDIIDVLTNFSH